MKLNLIGSINRRRYCVAREVVAVAVNHRPGRDYTNPRNFRIFRTGAWERRGAAEGTKKTRIFVGGYPTRNKGADTIVSFFGAYSPFFTANFPAATKMAFVVIYLMNPRLPWRPFRPGNPVRRAHPSDPAGRGHPSPMPNRSHP